MSPQFGMGLFGFKTKREKAGDELKAIVTVFESKAASLSPLRDYLKWLTDFNQFINDLSRFRGQQNELFFSETSRVSKRFYHAMVNELNAVVTSYSFVDELFKECTSMFSIVQAFAQATKTENFPSVPNGIIKLNEVYQKFLNEAQRFNTAVNLTVQRPSDVGFISHNQCYSEYGSFIKAKYELDSSLQSLGGQLDTFLFKIADYISSVLEPLLTSYCTNIGARIASRGGKDAPKEVVQQFAETINGKLIEPLRNAVNKLAKLGHRLNLFSIRDGIKKMEIAEGKFLDCSKTVEELIRHELAVNLIAIGYKQDDQQKIYDGGALLFQYPGSRPYLEPRKVTRDMVLVHGVVPFALDESGSWAETRRDSYVAPQEYVARFSEILKHGLRPSQREDSPFFGTRLSRLQEVWFFKIGVVKGSDYGLLNVTFLPSDKYAVFNAGKPGPAPDDEHFILTPTPIRGPFRVLFNLTRERERIKRGVEVRIYNTKEKMLLKDWIEQVRRLLHESNMSYEEV